MHRKSLLYQDILRLFRSRFPHLLYPGFRLHLLQLKELIIEHNRTEKQNPIREPDLLMILTGGKFATRRADGVYVVPIGCLRP